MKRWFYAIRLWCYICINTDYTDENGVYQGKGQPYKPLLYFAHRYDRRQENFKLVTKKK